MPLQKKKSNKKRLLPSEHAHRQKKSFYFKHELLRRLLQ